MNIITGIMIGIVTITIIALIVLGIEFLSQLYKTIKEIIEAGTENIKQIYCPHCGSNKTNQTTNTKRMVIVQLPDINIECVCFYCSNCSKRWFMELDTHERDDQHWCESETKWIPD